MSYSRKIDIADDRLQSGKQFAGFAADLTDSEIQQTIKVVNSIRTRYAGKPFTVQNLDALRDEVLTRLAGIGILASVDVAPCLNGEPPTVEIVGKVGDPGFNAATDHEKKRWEVLKANERGEDYYGQTTEDTVAKIKKRSKDE